MYFMVPSLRVPVRVCNITSRKVIGMKGMVTSFRVRAMSCHGMLCHAYVLKSPFHFSKIAREFQYFHQPIGK